MAKRNRAARRWPKPSYKNLLAGLSEQADEGELDELRAALSELDAGFDQRIGEKIRASTQLGNVRAPQVRSLLLSKLAAMGQRGIDCRLEALYPVEWVGMDVWDFTRCLRRGACHAHVVVFYKNFPLQGGFELVADAFLIVTEID